MTFRMAMFPVPGEKKSHVAAGRRSGLTELENGIGE